MIIRTQGLAKKFGHVQALADFTLETPAGSVFALVGPNGAGKTTLIKIFMNLIRPTAGQAEILDVDSRMLGPRELAQIGYVSENRRLPEWMRVGYFFSFCKEFYPGWRDEDLKDLVRAYELPLDRPLKSLSRGMKVKAALAAALAYRPQLLILDEPFSGLDMLVREQLIETVVERSGETTVFLASHDLGEIESFATHVAYLDQGRLEFVEEMSALSDRFREVEVVLENPAELPRNLPTAWLNPQIAGTVARFTDSQFDAARTEPEIRRRFTGIRDVSVRPVPLRMMFLALAKSAKGR